jgi:hypothetical protein
LVGGAVLALAALLAQRLLSSLKTMKCRENLQSFPRHAHTVGHDLDLGERLSNLEAFRFGKPGDGRARNDHRY